MRSPWSAERTVALLAAASFEAAWLTLAYLAVQWIPSNHGLHLGIGHFGVAALAGLLLARRVGGWARPRYVAAIVGASLVAGLVGTWLAVAPSLASADLVAVTAAHPGGWLLGVAVLRGAAVAGADVDAAGAERALNLALAGLVAFWLSASISGLAGAVTFAGPGFAATMTLVTTALLRLGLARLSLLTVETLDSAGRRRWVVLLLGVTGAMLVIGVPVAGALGLPVTAALSGIAGPLAPALLVVVTIIGAILALIAVGAIALVQPLVGGGSNAAYDPTTTGKPPAPGIGDATTFALPDLTWVLWLVVAAGIAVGLYLLVSALRQPRPATERLTPSASESRESEPIPPLTLPRLPRLRFGRAPPQRAPTSAAEAYRLALRALSTSAEARRSAESPREHARRIHPTPFGAAMARLAADYELSVFARRILTPAEERRAIGRWREVVTATRRSVTSPRSG